MLKIRTLDSDIVTLETQVRIAYRAPIENIIRCRSSCRSYTDKKLSAEQIDQLNLAFKSASKGLLGEKASFCLVDLKGYEGEKVKIGTYGMIVNPHTAIVGEIENSEMGFESYGFLLEHIVLKAQELGLNTCWLGYFSNKGSENFLKVWTRLSHEQKKVEQKSITPAICTVGYGYLETRLYRGLWDKVTKISSKPHIRKHFGEIFFDSAYNRPLAPKDAGCYHKPLEMIIPAPSAGNSQPWRMVMNKSKDAFHFYMEPSKRWDYNLLKLHKIDMGIAMCHFNLMVRELGYSGSWQKEMPDISVPRNVSYIATWVPNKN
jgi:nitroreductase